MENFTNNDTVIENHKTRKYKAKMIQKSQEVIIDVKKLQLNNEGKDDHVGIITKSIFTNEYRQRLKKEKYNITTWFERIRKAKDFGKKVFLINEENTYNMFRQNAEQSEKKYLQDLINTFGDDLGKEKYNKHINKIEKRSIKKYGF